MAVATYGNGVYVYDTQRRQRAHYHTENTPLQSNYLPALEYDADGNLWVAQLDDRTMILDRGTGRWRAFEVQKVRSLCECGDSTIVAGMVDGVAEDMLKLSLKPESTLKGFLAISAIKEAENKEVTSAEAFASTLKDFELLRDDVLAVKKAADESGDYLTSALMDDYIESFYKEIWMLRQVLK